MFSKLSLVSKIEVLLESMYNYYYTLPKHVLDGCMLGEFLEGKALKIFCNVKICWISMFFTTKWILTKHKTLVIQMFLKQVSNESTKAKLELLCGIEVFLGFDCIIPMLPCVQGLSKFAQT